MYACLTVYACSYGPVYLCVLEYMHVQLCVCSRTYMLMHCICAQAHVHTCTIMCSCSCIGVVMCAHICGCTFSCVRSCSYDWARVVSRESSLRLPHRDLCSRDKGFGPFYPLSVAHSQGQSKATERNQRGTPDKGNLSKQHQLLKEVA